MLKVTFLGTGTSQGIPIIGSTHPVCLSKDPKDKRLRVSVLISWEDHQIVIDCGPDFRQQMLRAEVDYLDGVLFTHDHADHTAGLDDIRPFCFRQGALPFYASTEVFTALEQRFSYIFQSENKYPGAPTVAKKIIHKNIPFKVGNKTIIPIEAIHYRMPVLGFRIDNFAYLTDVKELAEDQLEFLHDLDVLVLNALREEEHPSHLNLEQALALVEILAPKKAYFTHISHLLGFHSEVSKRLPQHVELAYDTLTLQIPSSHAE